MTRRTAGPLAALAALAALAVALPACSRGGDDEARPRPRPTTSTTAAAPTLAFTVTGLDANRTPPPGDDVVAKVKETLDRYLALAVVAPLHSGAPAGDLSPVFTQAALARLADPAARATLVDEGMPPATTKIEAPAVNAALASVADAQGLAVVAARIDLRVHAVGPGLDVDIVRGGDVVLVPEGDTWKIDVVHLQVSRDSRDAA